MIHEFHAVYEHGALRPLEPVSLPESKRVRLIISDTAGHRSEPDAALMDRARKETGAAGRIPRIEEVRDALSCIPGSISQDVIAGTGD